MLKTELARLDRKVSNLFNLTLEYKIETSLDSINVLGQFRKNREGYTLVFNSRLLKYEEYKQTIIHEYAHMVNRELNKTAKPHGREWKKIAKLLGLEKPRARTSLYGNILQKEYPEKYITIHCNCSEHFILRERIKSLKKGHYLRCKNCLTVLTSLN